jgi:hypothetical protein
LCTILGNQEETRAMGHFFVWSSHREPNSTELGNSKMPAFPQTEAAVGDPCDL